MSHRNGVTTQMSHQWLSIKQLGAPVVE